ncbi:sulfate transport system permease protein [Tumebacillus sp. BK434]|uniref:sulfate ABC transporter permease subunit CysT n=1 Tax=Tumebacillus sp. BK434 TaxID=2512169 RepID=UPI001045B0C0|nr:sulfate ABC transporter permease subunit CysT [Tumebacillus sp. BK434]TCP52163.1 sulfate transport system permease protein [Tumebacillus sp. BK434]
MVQRLLRQGLFATVLLYFFLLVVLPIVSVYQKGLSNGIAAFWSSIANPMAWEAVLLTLKLALLATLFNAVLGTVIAWVLVRYRFPGRRLLNSLVDLPFALPTAVGGLIILLLLGPQSFAGQLAARFGLEIVFQAPAIVIAMIFVTFPFVIRTLQPLLEELDPAEEEAAHTLGAGRARTFFGIVFPAIRPGLLAGAMLAFSRALAEFGAVVLVAGNIPGKTLLASVYVFGQIESGNPEAAAAVSVLLLTLSLVILWSIALTQKRRDAV